MGIGGASGGLLAYVEAEVIVVDAVALDVDLALIGALRGRLALMCAGCMEAARRMHGG